MLLGLLPLKLDPARIRATSTAEDERLTYDGSNFAAWYRWFASNRTEHQQAYFSSLNGPVPGFRVLKTRQAGKQFETSAALAMKGAEQTFSIDELSDGQRQLLALYLLLHTVEERTVLFLDEPDNYLSLREIQPWLAELDQVIVERKAQVFLVSHQAEAMNFLASRNAFVFTRRDNGATRITEFDSSDGSMPSDAVLYGTEAGH